MAKVRLLISFALLVGSAAVTYWLLQPEPDREDAKTDPAGSTESSSPVGSIYAFPSISNSIESNWDGLADDCLRPELLENHPMFAADAARLDSVAVTGPTLESYRGLSAQSLNDLAIQNDSAAMAVLGAISMLKSRGIGEQYAVPYLLFEGMSLHTYWEPSLEDPAVQQHLETARDWFYKSALRGRLLALYWVGEVDARLHGGAVGLGWVDESDYGELDAAQRTALMPQNVYNLLAFKIAPQLRDGPSGFVYEMIPKSERQAPILENLAIRFEQDRVAKELPPIIVTESTSPPWEEIQGMICEGSFNIAE